MTPVPPASALPIHLIVPCYNEAGRLDRAEWTRLARVPGVTLRFVDDGSTDATASVLAEIASNTPGIVVRSLPRNAGKAEAVRAGLIDALADSAPFVGFLDADLSTDVDEILRLAAVLAEHPRTDVLLGSRVQLLGRRIDRSDHRHYLGRVFATGASLALGLPVYDTQCGAKLFRKTHALERALATPFRSRWVFDVELLSRMLRGGGTVAALDPERILEVPLDRWRDVAGSKVTWHGGLLALGDLAAIAWLHRRGSR